MFILLYNYYYNNYFLSDVTSFDSTFLYLLVFFISIFSKFDSILNYFLKDEKIRLSTSTFVYNLISSSLIYYNISKYQWYYTNNLTNNYQYHTFDIFDKVRANVARWLCARLTATSTMPIVIAYCAVFLLAVSRHLLHAPLIVFRLRMMQLWPLLLTW